MPDVNQDVITGAVFAPLMILDRGFKNVSTNGRTAGFQLKVRITYYRGIYLSLLERFDVSIDGQSFGPEAITFSVPGASFPVTHVPTEGTARWNFGDPATLTVSKPGGLAPGLHDIEVTECLRISYHAPTAEKRVSIARCRKRMTLVQ